MIRVLLNILKYLLALGLLTYVIYSNWLPGNENGLEAVWQKHMVEGKPIHLLFLLASLLLFFMGVCGTLIRWHLMMLAQDMGIGFWNTIRIGLRPRGAFLTPTPNSMLDCPKSCSGNSTVGCKQRGKSTETPR
ncbi:hypothetical protein EBX93_14120 [bacterium]|nr:hypothetical protein [bacterium]